MSQLETAPSCDKGDVRGTRDFHCLPFIWSVRIYNSRGGVLYNHRRNIADRSIGTFWLLYRCGNHCHLAQQSTLSFQRTKLGCERVCVCVCVCVDGTQMHSDAVQWWSHVGRIWILIEWSCRMWRGIWSLQLPSRRRRQKVPQIQTFVSRNSIFRYSFLILRSLSSDW